MKLFGSRLFAQAIKAAGVGAALMLSVSVGHAQSGPFTGFSGSWSGNGTVALSDGTTERIRCKASYNVNSTGLGLKQTLRCASDSYKFDLSTDVTSQGNRIYGNWSEASRNFFGNLQGTAGGGQIEVFVEASGFAASVTLRTTGNKRRCRSAPRARSGASISRCRRAANAAPPSVHSAGFARPTVPRSRCDRLINHIAVGRWMKRSATRARAAKERGSQLSSRLMTGLDVRCGCAP